MKIQCDVCCKKEASVFCTADEAALCDVCDQRVHHANKLASKHQRFSLLLPSSSQVPICDICQEKRALLFCQQDRAILCQDCDVSLHTANEHTKKHSRYLLAGIKLSATACETARTEVTVVNGSDNTVPDFKSNKKTSDHQNQSSTASHMTNSCSNSTVDSVNNDQLTSVGSASNISEYLIESIPGWHFDDFFIDPATTTSNPFGFCKNAKNSDFEANEDMLSFFDVEHEKNISFSTQPDNFWVPQVPAASTTVLKQPTTFHQNAASTNMVLGTKQQDQLNVNANRLNKKCSKDDAFTVPQISSSVGFKRSRPFW